MSAPLTFRTENQWRYLRDGGGFDLLRVSIARDAYRRLSVALTVLGIGAGVTWWRAFVPVESSWLDSMGDIGREHGA